MSFIIERCFDAVTLASLWMVIGCILVMKKRMHTLTIITQITVTIGFIVLASPTGANYWARNLEKQYAVDENCLASSQANIFVILAAGSTGQPRYSEDWHRLHLSSFRRTTQASQLINSRSNKGDIIILSGGSEHKETVSDAALMRTLLAKLLHNEHTLFEESTSKNTLESAQHLKSLITEHSLPSKPVCLVTSAMHMPRALMAFEQAGIEASAVPVNFQSVQVNFFYGLIPQMTSALKSYDAVHEWLGILYYHIRFMRSSL